LFDYNLVNVFYIKQDIVNVFFNYSLNTNQQVSNHHKYMLIKNYSTMYNFQIINQIATSTYTQMYYIIVITN